jgi:hypothetical protein
MVEVRIYPKQKPQYLIFIKSPVDPGFVARALSDRSDTGKARDSIGGIESIPVLSESDHQPRSQLFTCARQRLEQGWVIQVLESFLDLLPEG